MTVAVVLGLVLAAGVLAALVAACVALRRLADAVQALPDRLSTALATTTEPPAATEPQPPTAPVAFPQPAGGFDDPAADVTEATEVTAVTWVPPAPVARLGAVGFGIRYAVDARRGRMAAADPVPVDVRAQLAARRAAERAATKAARREVRRAGLAAQGGM